MDCELPAAPDLEDTLQNGVILCKLGMCLLPDDPMWNRVYDLDQSKFKVGNLIPIVLYLHVYIFIWGSCISLMRIAALVIDFH